MGSKIYFNERSKEINLKEAKRALKKTSTQVKLASLVPVFTGTNLACAEDQVSHLEAALDLSLSSFAENPSWHQLLPWAVKFKHNRGREKNSK